MNTSLLQCINNSRVRLSENVDIQIKKNPVREFFLRPIRLFYFTLKIPNNIPETVKYYLNSDPIPNSKSAAVFDELIKSGVDRSEIWIPRDYVFYHINCIVVFFIRLPLVLYLISRKIKSKSKIDFIDLYIVLGRQVYRKLLRNQKNFHPIIISDVSPDLHMIWSAAALEGNRAIWWQDDNHHHGPIFYAICSAVVLNDGGFNAVRNVNSSVNIFQRLIDPPKSIKNLPIDPVMGLSTNAFFEANLSQRNFLRQLYNFFNPNFIIIRLHPNSSLTQDDFPEPWIIISPFDESIKNFSSRVDFVVVGNSAVQIRLLCEGLQVVHVPGLDPVGFDIYGYCKDGTIYGIKNLETFSFEVMNSHYQNASLGDKLRIIVGPASSSDVHDLNIMNKLL